MLLGASGGKYDLGVGNRGALTAAEQGVLADVLDLSLETAGTPRLQGTVTLMRYGDDPDAAAWMAPTDLVALGVPEGGSCGSRFRAYRRASACLRHTA